MRSDGHTKHPINSIVSFWQAECVVKMPFLLATSIHGNYAPIISLVAVSLHA